jgi:uncharacterized protein YndB with AHSA1/START domain
MSEFNPVRVEVTIAVPVDVVWNAFRDPVELRRWFGWDYEGLDDEIEAIFLKGVSVSEAERTLSWETTEEQDGHVGSDRITLEEHGEGTVVRVIRSAPAAGEDWPSIYDDIDQGWLTFVQQLRFALERHPGDERRTLRLAGTVDGAPPLAAAVGIEPAAPGERYRCTDETLAGEVWHRSGRQLGVTVDAYGDGLVVLIDYRPQQAKVEAVITTYGLDDAAFERVRQRWTDWWSARHPS